MREDMKGLNSEFVLSQEDEARLDVLRKDGKLTLTDAQKRAVLTKGKILVSAAAGSGKTSTMVKRIMLMLAEGYSLRNMLTLVYNTAAADELRERLHSELFDRVCSEVGELREKFRKELDDLPLCHICTIHSFCNTLIRDNFEKLGISPTFEVLDEQAHATYMNEALDNVFNAYSEENDEIFGDIAEIFLQARKEENLKTNIIKLHNLIDVNPDRDRFISKAIKCFESFEDSEFIEILVSYYKSFFENAVCRLSEISEIISATSLVKYSEALAITVSFAKQELSATSLRNMLSIACACEKPNLGRRSPKLSDFEKEKSNIAKAYIDEVYSVAAELCELKDIIDDLEVKHTQNGLYVNKIIQITLRFADELQKLKQADNVLSFEDLQHYASRLLSDYPDLAGMYDAVFVDEYQDVNPTQEFIIQRLVKDECFMVGDVKQSIYGFRLADPKIFLSRQESYKNGEGAAIDFNRNFRSARKILAFVNGVFNAVMTEKSADVDYKNTAAFELDGAPEGGSVQVHLFTDKKAERTDAAGLYDITNHTQSDEDISGSQTEGRYIASEIKSLVGRAKKDGGYIGYGDIAILFRSRSRGAQQIIEELKMAGIPVDESVFGRTVSKPERELICMLRVIDNPRQDIPLAGFLLSFFGGFDEGELAVMAMEEGDCLYDKLMAFLNKFPECETESVSREDRIAAKLNGVLKMLENYRIKASFKSVSELMGGIVSDFCYDAYLMSSGEAEVYGLKSFIAGVAGQKDCSLGKFLDGYSEGADSRIAAGGGERVHISTFHGFKGLEIPITFVADTAFGFNYESGSGDLVALGEGYIGLKYFDFESKLKYNTLSRIAVSKLAKQQRIKEEMRLFYVALTRAKQMTYVTASLSAKKSGEFGVIDKIGGESCDLDFISTAICRGSVDVAAFSHTAEDFPLREEIDGRNVLAPNERIVEAIRKGREFSYPYAASTRLAMKYSVSALDSMDEQTVRVYEEGASVGTVYHKVMQYIDFFATGEDKVALELERLESEGVLTAEERSLVDVSLITACLDSEIMKLARDAQLNGKCYREQPFMMYKPAREIKEEFSSDDKVLVQGVVDLFICGERNVLVDFKCSHLDDKKLVEKYKTQLYLYKTAIESAISEKIDDVLIYSFLSKHTLKCSE